MLAGAVVGFGVGYVVSDQTGIPHDFDYALQAVSAVCGGMANGLAVATGKYSELGLRIKYGFQRLFKTKAYREAQREQEVIDHIYSIRETLTINKSQTETLCDLLLAKSDKIRTSAINIFHERGIEGEEFYHAIRSSIIQHIDTPYFYAGVRYLFRYGNEIQIENTLREIYNIPYLSKEKTINILRNLTAIAGSEFPNTKKVDLTQHFSSQSYPCLHDLAYSYSQKKKA